MAGSHEAAGYSTYQIEIRPNGVNWGDLELQISQKVVKSMARTASQMCCNHGNFQLAVCMCKQDGAILRLPEHS